MLYWFADAVLSILFLLIGSLHLGLSNMPWLCWLCGGALYSFIFHFAVCRHRAIPRFVIVIWFMIQDLQRHDPIGSSALSILCSIELVRLYLDSNDKNFKKYQLFGYIMFVVFVFIYHMLNSIIINVISGSHLPISSAFISTTLAVGVHIALSKLWCDLYTTLYRYHNNFVR